MRPDEQVAAVADRLAHPRDVRLGAGERLEARLARVERRVRAERVELERSESLRDVGRGAFRREVGIRVHIDRVVGLGIEIGVGAKLLVHAPAQEFEHGPADRLADDVPAGHLDPAHDALQREVGAPRVAARRDPAGERFDCERIRAFDVAVEDVGDHRLERPGVECRRVHLADARDPVVGGEREEYEVTPPERRWRVPDDKGAELRDPHEAGTLALRIAGTRTMAATPRAPRAGFRGYAGP